jgi:hypothetical protein
MKDWGDDRVSSRVALWFNVRALLGHAGHLTVFLLVNTDDEPSTAKAGPSILQ